MTAGLSGITVVDLTQGVSGPFATRLMAQMGARVIKVERPGSGDIIRFWDDIVHGMCSGHAWVNPGKESIELNLKEATGRDILKLLIAKADILIENFVPGTMSGWGLDYPTIKAIRPDIIFCHISGFGQDGPYSDRSALDLIIQGESGLIPTNGPPEQAAKISIPVCDLAGSMFALTGILEALFHRQRTGVGQELEVSLLEAVMTWTGYFPYIYWYSGKVPERVGLHHHTMAPYGPYACSDGRNVIVAAGAGASAMWSAFCNAIERPEIFDDARFVNNARRLANRVELDEIVGNAIGSKDLAYWLDRFHSFGIPSGALNTIAQALEHPVLRERKFIKEVSSAVGQVKVMDLPSRSSAYKSVNDKGPPLLGEHTQAILRELGIVKDDLGELKETGAV
jgi:itaconate CoA-transferase